MKFNIEKASLEDVDWIAEFQKKMALETEALVLKESEVVAGVERVLSSEKLGFYLYAKDEGKIPAACLLVLSEWSDWRNAPVWWIHSVYVEKAFRRKGLFSLLYVEVKKRAQLEGVRGIRLYVEKGNKTAKQVYSKIGMSNEHYELYEEML